MLVHTIHLFFVDVSILFLVSTIIDFCSPPSKNSDQEAVSSESFEAHVKATHAPFHLYADWSAFLIVSLSIKRDSVLRG